MHVDIASSTMVHAGLLLTSLVLCFPFKGMVKFSISDTNGQSGITNGWVKDEKMFCQIHGWFLSNGKATTCDSTSENCTVVSPTYNITEVNELFINVTTDTRNCNTISKPCQQWFILLALYADIKIYLGMVPSPLYISSSNFSKTSTIINFSKDQKYKEVQLGLQETLYCGTVKSFSVFYYKCPTGTSELVDFEEEVAPNKSASPKELTGKCTSNAIQKSPLLLMRCYYDGTVQVFGSCECKAGFTNHSSECKGQPYFFIHISNLDQNKD